METTISRLVVWAQAADRADLNRRLITEKLETLPQSERVQFQPKMIHEWRHGEPYDRHVRMMVQIRGETCFLDVPLPDLGRDEEAIVSEANRANAVAMEHAVEVTLVPST